jgi:hypothetical protein
LGRINNFTAPYLFPGLHEPFKKNISPDKRRIHSADDLLYNGYFFTDYSPLEKEKEHYSCPTGIRHHTPGYKWRAINERMQQD